MINLLTYTHSDYRLVYDVWLRQTMKHISSYKLYTISDSIPKTIEDEIIWYGDTEIYNDRMKLALQQLDPEMTVIFQHEDMFLYRDPDLDTIYEFIDIVKNDQADLIRLIRVVDPLLKSTLHPDLYENPVYSKFSIQPTIIKIKTLQDIFSRSNAKDIWDFERDCERNCGYLRSYFPYRSENKRGMFHFDSDVYPYVATAITKGQWNFAEYNNELTPILKEYKVL